MAEESYFGMVNNSAPTPVGQQTCCAIYNEPWTDPNNPIEIDREACRTLLLDYVGLQYLQTSADPFQRGFDFRPWRGPNMHALPAGNLSWTRTGQFNCRLGGPAAKAVFLHGYVLTTPGHPMAAAPAKDYWLGQEAMSREQRYCRPIVLEPGWGFAIVGAVNPHLFADFQWVERPVTDEEWARLQEWAAENP